MPTNFDEIPPIRLLSLYLAPDGEANAFHQGSWTVFVRTAGCTVGCVWCDTMYSWSPKRGRNYTVAELIAAIEKTAQGCRKITLTGGEPLEQPRESLKLLFEELLRRDFKITVETSGTESVGWLKYFNPNLALVLDFKPPSAQITRPMLMDNFMHLLSPHVVKFVVGSDADYEAAKMEIKHLREQCDCTARLVLSPLMPVGKQKSQYTLGEWVEKMKADGLPRLGVGLNLQLHKVIHPADAREEEVGGLDYTDIRKPDTRLKSAD